MKNLTETEIASLLSQSERRVFELLCDPRLAGKDIAKNLMLAYPTIKFHASNIYRKLGIRKNGHIRPNEFRQYLIAGYGAPADRLSAVESEILTLKRQIASLALPTKKKKQMTTRTFFELPIIN